MNKFLMSCALVAMTSVPTIAQDDADDEWYVGIGGSINWTHSTVYRGLGNRWDDNPKAGNGTSLMIGKEFGKYRGELEGTYRHNAMDELLLGRTTNNLAGANTGGNTNVYSLMVNVYRDFKFDDSALSAYVGAGAGFAEVHYKLFRSDGVGLLGDQDTGVAGQLMVGVIHEIADNVDLDIGYRYFATVRSNVVKADGNSTSPLYRAHSMMATLKYRFGGSSYKAAAPTPAPVAEPIPEPTPVVAPKPEPKPEPAPKPKPKPVVIPGPFVVFFDFDEAEITPEAATIIRNAAEAYKKFGVASINAVGHTDKAGRDSYNDKLSNARAEAVKAELARNGVSMDKISVSGEGESMPLVATDDGAREPQNRRVEITLVK